MSCKLSQGDLSTFFFPFFLVRDGESGILGGERKDVLRERSKPMETGRVSDMKLSRDNPDIRKKERETYTQPSFSEASPYRHSVVSQTV